MKNMLIGCLLAVVILLIGGIVFVACLARQRAAEPSAQSQSNADADPTIDITFPANGARVKIGQPFQVHAIGSDPRGIFSIAVSVDGQALNPVVASPPLTKFSAAIPITLSTKGVHTIAVQANSTTGTKSSPAVIRIVAVQTLNDAASPGDPPTPTPQVAVGPTPTRAPDQPPSPPIPPNASVNFTANPMSVQPGQCSTLRWDASGVREIYFEGVGVTGHEQRQQCPSQTTTYTLRVVFQDGTTGDFPATVTVTQGGGGGGSAPTAPTNLRVVSTTKTTARIAWDDRSNSETGFEIEIEGAQNPRTGAGETQYEAIGLACRRSYNFRVRAFNATGTSAWSNQVTAQTLACEGNSSFAVTNITMAVMRSNYEGPCPNTFSAGSKITANGAGTVRYRWEQSNGVNSDIRTVEFDAAGEKSVANYDWRIADSGRFSVVLHVLEPNDMTSIRGEANWTCAPSFKVTNVTANVDPQIFSGTCPKSINYSGVITTNGPGTVTYKWVRSDGTGEERTVTFAAAGSQTVTSGNVTYNQSGTQWAKLEVTAPNALTSEQAKFTLNCASPAIVTVVSVNANPTGFTGTCPHTFHFNATIVTNGPGTVTYRWERSDGNSDTRTINFASADSQTIQSGDYRSGTSGSFWARLHIITPNEKVSNQATFTLTCQ